MKAKWCICILILTLTLLGVTNNQQNPLPNQEIVLQFNNNEVTSEEAQHTIALVKKQLCAIGVLNIQVQKQEAGKLKITYYSESDVLSIKKILLKEKDLAFGFVSSSNDEIPIIPHSKNKSKTYNLDIFEIHQQDNGTGFVGKFAIIKSDNNRFFNLNLSISSNKIDFKDIESIIKKSFSFPENISLTLEDTSHKIPEVRAGPIG